MNEETKFAILFAASYETINRAIIDFNDLNDEILRNKFYGLDEYRQWVKCKDETYDMIIGLVAELLVQAPKSMEDQSFVDLVNMVKFTYLCVDGMGNTSLYTPQTRKIAESIKYDYRENILALNRKNKFPDELCDLVARANEFVDGHPVPMTNEEFDVYKNIRRKVGVVDNIKLQKHNPIKMMYLKERADFIHQVVDSPFEDFNDKNVLKNEFTPFV